MSLVAGSRSQASAAGVTAPPPAPAPRDDEYRTFAPARGAQANAGGTITFRLWSDVNCTQQVGNSSVVTVTNGADNQNYDSALITVNAAGTYHWTAVYSGDANNAAATAAPMISARRRTQDGTQDGLAACLCLTCACSMRCFVGSVWVLIAMRFFLDAEADVDRPTLGRIENDLPRETP